MFSTDCYLPIVPNITPKSRVYSSRILWIDNDGYGIYYVLCHNSRRHTVLDIFTIISASLLDSLRFYTSRFQILDRTCSICFYRESKISWWWWLLIITSYWNKPERRPGEKMAPIGWQFELNNKKSQQNARTWHVIVANLNGSLNFMDLTKHFGHSLHQHYMLYYIQLHDS